MLSKPSQLLQASSIFRYGRVQHACIPHWLHSRSTANADLDPGNGNAAARNCVRQQWLMSLYICERLLAQKALARCMLSHVSLLNRENSKRSSVSHRPSMTSCNSELKPWRWGSALPCKLIGARKQASRCSATACVERERKSDVIMPLVASGLSS